MKIFKLEKRIEKNEKRGARGIVSKIDKKLKTKKFNFDENPSDDQKLASRARLTKNLGPARDLHRCLEFYNNGSL